MYAPISLMTLFMHAFSFFYSFFLGFNSTQSKFCANIRTYKHFTALHNSIIGFLYSHGTHPNTSMVSKRDYTMTETKYSQVFSQLYLIFHIFSTFFIYFTKSMQLGILHGMNHSIFLKAFQCNETKLQICTKLIILTLYRN